MNETNRINYHIYGRKEYARPLEFVEIVEAADATALEIPKGSEWVEVIAFPESAAIQVIPRPEEAIQ